MKEKEHEGIAGKSLRVYPFLPDDAGEEQTVFGACVEALRHWDDPASPQSARTWKVQINISSYWMTREESDAVAAAIKRAWEWVDEQDGAQAKPEWVTRNIPPYTFLIHAPDGGPINALTLKCGHCGAEMPQVEFERLMA